MCVIVCVCEEDLTYMRFLVNSDENDLVRSARMLTALTAEFPDMRSPSLGMSQYLDFLKQSGHH